MEALGGVEPPTCGLGNRRSIHLSYRAVALFYRTVNPRAFGAQTVLHPKMRKPGAYLGARC